MSGNDKYRNCPVCNNKCNKIWKYMTEAICNECNT